MKKIGRDTWLGIILLLVLVVVTIAAAIRQTQQTSLPPLVSISSEPNGTQALRLWLEGFGYQVSGEDMSSFQVPYETAIIFMLEPLPGFTEEEWGMIDRFVEGGGLLVLAGDEPGAQLALSHYEVRLSWLDQPVEELMLQTPMLQSPAVETQVRVNASGVLETDRRDYVTLLASQGRPITVSVQMGTGRVILSSTAYPFSNAGLKEEGNPSLVLNIISAAAQRGSIWFDEWHHGLRSQPSEILGAESWLRHTSAGRALIYVAVIIFLSLVLQGQRFGRPVPLPRTLRRRAPMEYIAAIANLSRRAGHRAATLRSYENWLKRSLGKRYHLDPMLADIEYVERLSQFNPDLDRETLTTLLKKLKNQNVTEAEFVQLGAEVSRWGVDT